MRPQLRGAHPAPARGAGRSCAPAIASHNLRSVAHAIASTARSGGEDRDLEFQVLRGLGDDLAAALADLGHARAHLLPGRRPGGRHGVPRPAPAREHRRTSRSCSEQQRGDADRASCWRRRESLPQRADPGAAARAGARVAARRRCASSTPGCRWTVPVLDRRRRAARPRLDSTDPGAPDRRRGARRQRRPRPTPPQRSRRPSAASATGARARRRARRGPARRRRAACASAALELAALQVRECAKPWPEADGDVCEAIDFLEYYAREAVALDAGRDAAPGARRAQHDALRAARRGRRDRAVELPARDPAAA